MKAVRVDVAPDADGVASVRHELDTEAVTVHAVQGPDGDPRAVYATTVIDRDEVEILTDPDTTAVMVTSTEVDE